VTLILTIKNSDGLILGLAWMVVLLGVPHGSLDSFYAKLIFNIKGFNAWIYFGLAYLFCAALVVLLWMIAPGIFFALFLLISGIHFSGDLESDELWFTRLIYGGSIIILPFFIHSVEVTRLFALIIPTEHANNFTLILKPLSQFWLLGAVIAVVTSLLRKSLDCAYLLISLVLLATLVPSLIAFTLYFCVMHSPRHILRTLSTQRNHSTRIILQSAALPTVLAVLGFFLLGWIVPFQTLEGRILQIGFVGLAALTVPHMILLKVEHARSRRRTDSDTLLGRHRP
jgi:Brp/Blh family beta-carotene 15,15'-monooxygenase